MGKGSSPRPFSDRPTFEENFDKIFRSHLKDNKDLHNKLAEYELDKSTGEVIRVTT